MRRLLALLTWMALASAAAANDQALDQLLARLGLNDLRLHHLERRLERETDREKRLAMARELADAYAEQLLSVADEPERYAALKERLDGLLATTPDARTPAIDVVLLQAEYQRAETLVIRWMENPADNAPLGEAAAILETIAPRLASTQKELLAAADAEAEALEPKFTDQDRESAEQQLLRQQAIAARAGYFAAWSQYYLGVAKQNTSTAEPHFRAAQEQFAAVLDVAGGENYTAIEADGLGLESIWRARAAIGLGLAELGLKRLPPAATVFGWLEHASVPPTLRDQAAYWQVQGMLNVGLVAEAAALVQRQVDGFGTHATPGKSSLCIAAIRSGAALDESQAEHRRRLIEQGIRGLARMRQFETLDKLIEKHNLPAALDANSFHLAWLCGRRQFFAAEKSKSADDYRQAAAALRGALAQPSARSDVADSGQARYYLAWCHYRLEELEQAARLFQESAVALRAPLADLAVQAAWMQCTCLVQLAAQDKKYATQAVSALQSYRQDYPASENAARAELLVTRLRQAHATPQESIRELAAIEPGDANYVWAQYELAQLHYQEWSKVKSDPEKAAPSATGVLQAVERFLAQPASGNSAERRLKAALLAVDVLLAAESPELPRVTALLKRVSADAGALEPSSPAVVEYQYRRLQLAQKTGDATTVSEAAESIATHGAGSAYELPALIVVARAADQAVEAAGPTAGDRREQAVEEAAQVYARLVQLLGDSPPVLSSNKNAVAAASKLAHYDELRGRWSEAAARYQRLVAAAPNDRRWLRRAALASVNAGRHAQALEHWRKLLAGAASGSDDWLEAKYYQLVCLQKTDRATAQKVWKQFKLLFPEVKSATWRDKFAELETQFGGE